MYVGSPVQLRERTIAALACILRSQVIDQEISLARRPILSGRQHPQSLHMLCNSGAEKSKAFSSLRCCVKHDEACISTSVDLSGRLNIREFHSICNIIKMNQYLNTTWHYSMVITQV